MKDIAIYGAGGFGREVALLIRQINQQHPTWNLVGFFDDAKTSGTMVDDYPVLGGMNDLKATIRPMSLVVAIADPLTRMNIVSQLSSHLDFPVLIHPGALTGSPYNHFDRGCIITAGCIMTTGVSIGEFVILNLSSTVGHDVRIASFSTIMPGCNISGNVTIGEATSIGTGAQVLQNLAIGKQCQVGAGAVVTKSFSDGVTVVGVPARLIKS